MGKFKIVRDDITRVRADALVTLPDYSERASYGVNDAVRDCAGPAFVAEQEKLGRILPGEAWTTGAFDLGTRAKYIISASGPVRGGVESDPGPEQLLSACYSSILREAVCQGCRSVAIPLVSSGLGGFAPAEAIAAAVQTVEKFQEIYAERAPDVTLVVFTPAAFAVALEKWPDYAKGNDHLEEGYEVSYRRSHPPREHACPVGEPLDYAEKVKLLSRKGAFRGLLKEYLKGFFADQQRRREEDEHKDVCADRYYTSYAGVVDLMNAYYSAKWTTEHPTDRSNPPKLISRDYLKRLMSQNGADSPGEDIVDAVAKVIKLSPEQHRRLRIAAGIQ